MKKITLDQYYTPENIAKYCVDKTKDIIGSENITEYLEPSAGGGVFLKFLDKPFLAYDIEPYHKSIVQQDYLELELPYKEGRCIIGNPPYGKSNVTSVKFFKKAITQGDYISFILPISQLNNNMYMYEFDMIHSEDLGKVSFFGRFVHCVLNIYKRNPKGFNTMPKFDLEDVVLKIVNRGKSRNDKVPEEYDFSICTFGASIGKICEYDDQYSSQTYFIIKNKELKEPIRKLIETTNWTSIYNMTATPKLPNHLIYKYLKEKIPNIK